MFRQCVANIHKEGFLVQQLTSFCISSITVYTKRMGNTFYGNRWKIATTKYVGMYICICFNINAVISQTLWKTPAFDCLVQLPQTHYEYVLLEAHHMHTHTHTHNTNRTRCRTARAGLAINCLKMHLHLPLTAKHDRFGIRRTRVSWQLHFGTFQIKQNIVI